MGGVGGGLSGHDSRLGPENFVSPLGLVAGAMLIFLNYEGFELIANASKDVANPKRSLPIAYIGGVLIVIAIYVLIVMVVVGHLSFTAVAKGSDYALSIAADEFMGRAGYIGIAIAALTATSSAINATFYSTGRLTYIVAKTGQLPKELERSLRGQHFEGTLITAALALVIANFVPLEAIATMHDSSPVARFASCGGWTLGRTKVECRQLGHELKNKAVFRPYRNTLFLLSKRYI